MRVLAAHNLYQQPGGEDVVFEAEIKLLESKGNEVVRYVLDNDAIQDMGSWRAGATAVWSRKAYAEVYRLCQAHQPDVAHFHNTFPLMSPAVYYAARRSRVPVVQTLHNFRILCPNALFFRDGRSCEDCLGRTFPMPAIRHRCYRASRSATSAVAAMSAFHRIRGTWSKQVDAFIALTEFAKDRFVKGGLPEAKIHVLPNFLPEDPGPGTGDGGFALFVGRLAVEKGLAGMLEAWRRMDGKIPLKIVGDGPEAGLARAGAAEISGVEYLGPQPHGRVIDLMKSAACLVFPSVCYEGVSMSLLEAMAVGLPAVAGNHGSIPHIVKDGQTGYLYNVADPADLAAKVATILNRPEMRSASRRRFADRYAADAHYEALIKVYDTVRA